MENSKLEAVLLSSPGFGHLIPVLELGKRLVTLHSFRVTVFTVATTESSPAESQLVKSATIPDLLSVVELPQPDISTLVDADAAVSTRIVVMMRETIPSFKGEVAKMKVPPALLIVDLFGFEVLEIPEFDMPRYVFVTSTAWLLALTLYLPTLDMEVEGEYVDRAEPLQLPGCKSVRPEDVVDPMLERTNQQYREYLRMGNGIPKGNGVLLNTWNDLEPITLRALGDPNAPAPFAKVPVYPIGPITRSAGQAATGNELLEWLDLQPNDSVVYVCFGSGGTLSSAQLTELAWGLELSQQRFIWVVRPPTENDRTGSFFEGGEGGQHPSDYLPQGFLARTKNVGVVVPVWAPQADIISHPSVGGFVSHCGWNSTLESIVNGVPMVAWPLYSEQRLNCSMMAEELGIAVRPEVLPTKGVVRREEIEKMVRKVMKDEEMRKRVEELRKSGEKALSEGGSSYNSLRQLAASAGSFHKK